MPERSAQLEAKLQESENRLRLALEASRMGVWEWEIPTNRVSWSAECYEFFGLSSFDGTFDAFGRLVHPEDVAAVTTALETAVAKGGDYSAEFRVRTPDGQVRWVANLGRTYYDDSGLPLRMVGTVQDVTPRRLATERLQQQEERLSLALEATRTGVWEWNIPTNQVVWSPECYDIVDLDRFDGTLDAFLKIVHPDDSQGLMAAAEAAIAGHSQYTCEYRIVHPDGAIRWVADVGRAFYDREGRPVRLLGTVRDITEERRGRVALEEEGAAFRQLAEQLPHMTWTAGPDGAGTFMSRSGLDFHGLSNEELKTRWPEMVHPADRAGLLAAQEAGLAQARPWFYEARLRRHDGVYRRFEVRAVPLVDGDGQVTKWFGTLTDVEERQQTRERLEQEEIRLARIAAVAPGVLYSFRLRPDGHTSIPYASPTILDLFGLRSEDLAVDAAPVFARMPAEDAARLQQGIAESARTMTPWHEEWRFAHPVKGEVWMEGNSTPVPEADGSIVWHGVITDITQRKRDEKALRESEARFRQLAESLPQVGWTCTPDGEDEYSSAQWLEYAGIPASEAQHSRWLELIHPEDRATAAAAWTRAIAEGTEYRVQCRIRRYDGVYRWFDIRGTPLRDAKGKIVRWFGTNTDIHEERELREQLRLEQERLATVATVSPAVIHSFRLAPDGAAFFPYASPGIEALSGLTPEELARDAAPMFQRIAPEDVERLRERTAESARHLTPWEQQFRLRHPTRGEIWIECHSSPVRDPDGGTTWHGVLLDITERKRMERRLRLRSDALETSLTAFAMVRNRRFVYANRTYLRMWGYDTLEEILGTSPAGHCIDPLVPGRIVETVARDGQCIIEFTARRKDGSTFETRLQLQCSVGDDGAETYFGTAIDITEEKQAQATIRKWADAFVHCGHGIAMGSPVTNRLLACNPAFARLLGQDQADLEGRQILGMYPPEEHERIRSFLAEADRNGRARHESQYLRADGSRVDVQVDLVTVRAEDGSPLYRIATAQNITERKLTEESLRVTRDQLRAIDRASPVPIIALSPSGTVFHWNRAAEQLFGWRAEEVLGHALPIVPVDKEAEYIAFRSRVMSGASFTETTERHTKDGRRVDVRISTSPLHDEEGKRIGFVALYVDLTEQKALETALKASEERFAMAFKASPTGNILIRESDRTVLEVNQAMEQLTGFRREELIGRTTAELSGFRGQSRRDALWRALGEAGRVVQIDYPFRKADGTIRHALASAERIQLGGEAVVLGVLLDVTERKLAEQALRESEERLRLFIEHAPASLAMLDREMRYLSVSRRWLSDYGLGETELRGRSHYELFPEIPDRWKAIHQRALAGEVVRADADRFERADGSVQWLRWEVRPWHDSDEQVGGILVFSEDITASLGAQEALRESETRFRQLAENIHEVFWLTDLAKGRMIYISPGYEQIWGRSCQALYDEPRDWLAAIHPDDRDRVLQAALTKQVNGTYDEEYRIVRPDGSIRWIRDQAFPVRDEHGTVTRVAGVAEDITERRQLEAQVRQTQKMESVGLLAGGVAHDFNNWLTVISGSAELLLETAGVVPECGELLREIQHASERATALTRQLLAFSRREVLEPRVMDLNAIILDTEKMLRRLLGEDVLLETSLAPGLSRVKVDPGHWTQVLMNLAVNARDAMPTGGRLTMETREQTLDESFTRSRPSLQPGRYVVLAISDTGCGMPPEVRARIFEPFFTTKGMGKGTGLGLAVVHGIVAQSGGHIEVYSEVGVGTTFRIYLAVAAELAAGSAPSAAAPQVRGTEIVLVVEDEESIRRVAYRGLRANGYTVLQAGDGEEALAVLERHGGTVDLLLTDVVMPRMNGRALAEAMRAHHPGLKVLYTSGYTDDAVVRHGILQADVAFLPKPYTPLSLLRKIRQVLDGA
jgi:two-component system cell cycle sensor histidine kinase/response regulator CckA